MDDGGPDRNAIIRICEKKSGSQQYSVELSDGTCILMTEDKIHACEGGEDALVIYFQKQPKKPVQKSPQKTNVQKLVTTSTPKSYKVKSPSQKYPKLI